MTSPLDEFANSPRRFRNADNSEVISSSLVKLGPGIVASRASGAPGETTFVTIDAPGVASQAAQIAALTARVEALETALGLPGDWPVLDTIEVRRIIAKGTGNPPDINVADLQIVTKTVAVGVYEETMRFVSAISADMNPATQLAFYGGTAQKKQTLTAGWTVGDLQARLENYNFVVEVP